MYTQGGPPLSHPQQQQHPQMQQFAQQQAQQPFVSMTAVHPESAKHPIQDRIRHIMPPPMSIDTLNNLGDLTVVQLCQTGREIVQDISVRAMNVLSFFKLGVNRRTNPAFDIEAILAYSKFLFQKLQEIRIRLDKIRMEQKSKPIKEDAFFEQITNPEPVDEENQSSTKQALLEQFEENRAKIIETSNKIKKLEWYAATVDLRN